MSVRPTRIGLPGALKSMAPSPSTTASSRRRDGRDTPVVLTQETIAEAVSRDAPLRSTRLCQTPATRTWLWRFPTRTAMQAVNACSRHNVRHVRLVCWRTSRAARALGAPQAATGATHVAGGCGASARACAPLNRAG